MLLTCFACNDGEEDKNPPDERPPFSWPVKADPKLDGQWYTEGEVQFPVSLWNVPSSEICSERERKNSVSNRMPFYHQLSVRSSK